ncbi:hypothetical protein J31TS4_06180 [Paenibacillus sp. J31TS4]|uniref:DNA mismatch repair endonuclease MutL n=1 Tax=Paenibacillus sp. J31TS4 TaxID=2807195 RepID=UPI001B204281|nr:DNA mismatch repair endonuclease MutL [Paenibacillus sp. J31TS4]GIP37338.1 hypothetical protein J31TS4_06180 [Paenibacillus sp. J31TS4]
MATIRILDDHIANQIAAGEVVERPSSVVKELVENSIDAGSTRIDVELQEGGIQSIRVADNGSGIERDDLRTAFLRHATSKLASGKDLFRIATLGFRGEALPSIAAVAKVTCTTSTDGSGLGSRLVLEGGTEKSFGDSAASRGTDIRVDELFYNTPARLKYLKTIQTELGHISDYLYRLALAHPEIAFSLTHNEHLLLRTLGNGDLLQVVAAVYGTSAAKQMLPISAEDPDYKMNGYISKPELTRSNRLGISVIVNGRYVRHYGLTQAVLKGYHTLLPINRYPLVVLHVEMDPGLVDVNVHPSKLEVRFSKEANLQQLAEETVREALRQTVLIPQGSQPKRKAAVHEQLAWYDADEARRPVLPPEPAQQPYAEPGAGRVPGAGGASAAGSAQRAYAEPRESRVPGAGGAPATGSAQRAYAEPRDSRAPGASGAPAMGSAQRAYAEPREGRAPGASGAPVAGSAQRAYAEPREGRAPGASGAPVAGGAAQRPYAGRTALPSPEQTRRFLAQASGGAAEPALPAFPQLTPIGQLHGTYILAQNEDGLYMIDQHAAHERINYEYYYEKFGQPADASQELLVPLTLDYTSAEAEALKEKLPLLEQAGVYLESFGGGSFLVRAYPHWLPHGEEQQVIEEMVEWLLTERQPIDLAKLREKSSTLCSCKASIKANQQLTRAEIESLLSRLAACRIPYTCPHGRPILVSFSTYELEKMFKRVM